MTRTVMIVAGGTGGHVYPGLAVAEALRARDVQLHWMGTERGIEARVVPLAGVPLTTIPVSGLRRRGWWRWLAAPFGVSYAIWCALAAMRRIRPQVVLGMGGFVSGPGGIAAWLTRRPLIIHEQNAVPGLSNRILAHFARRVLQGFPGSFAAKVHAITTGNPVRADIAAISAPRARTHDGGPLNVLVFGGSRGARALNEHVPQALAQCGIENLRVRHQCGADDVAATAARYAQARNVTDSEVVPYIDDMTGAYAWADLVIARAGASSIAEIAACGVASILIPYPYAVDDHQSANARYLAAGNAAVLMSEAALSVDTLAREIARLLGDAEARMTMAESARALSRPHATADVAAQCLEFIDA
ncbi:MAG: undecaprenyldiphospho-muramoylpentapeptide beta-N-acetylglucosaminyltransferase [Gammaproteobacteria bacterium]|nr:undecaprenyldiphospho-muramoylpentapeptide beta-N-acetylglucosaminyltransferase [Gammaproteobacteria bacterium]